MFLTWVLNSRSDTPVPCKEWDRVASPNRSATTPPYPLETISQGARKGPRTPNGPRTTRHDRPALERSDYCLWNQRKENWRVSWGVNFGLHHRISLMSKRNSILTCLRAWFDSARCESLETQLKIFQLFVTMAQLRYRLMRLHTAPLSAPVPVPITLPQSKPYLIVHDAIGLFTKYIV